MIYRLVRPLARYVLSWYYRRIEIDGLEHIPAEGPVIFAANHPTAFIEPCILACYQGRALWFLARGNLFKNSLANWVLGQLHILPVYRIEDGGYGKLKNNYATFSACRNALGQGRAIMILAEGRCIHEKRLRPLRKGTGRIALSALVENPELEDVPVLPIGVNFTYPDRMRSTVMIRIGEPLSSREFLPAYRENENKGVLDFTRALALALDPLVIQIPGLELDAIGETVFQVDRADRNRSLLYGFSTEAGGLDREISLATLLAKIDPRPIEAYANRLRGGELKESAVSGSWSEYLELGLTDWLKFFLATLLLLWFLPILLVAEYIGGTSTRHIEFYSPVRFAAATVAMVVIPPLWLIGINPWLIGYAIISIIFARWAWGEWEKGLRWYHARAAWRQTEMERKILKSLRLEVQREIKRVVQLPEHE
ncbi:hypothetical protein CEQ90_01320 [Lewinellaceae bacterium SD302]|nr:hypothetical protein CEQ90_01320 [Lewinellaceae bacterium SD302]